MPRYGSAGLPRQAPAGARSRASPVPPQTPRFSPRLARGLSVPDSLHRQKAKSSVQGGGCKPTKSAKVACDPLQATAV